MKRTEQRPKLCVAIDGPAGSGKSTVARLVADRLGYLYIDTGALYRAVTLAVLKAGVSPASGTEAARVAMEADIALDLPEPGSGHQAPGAGAGRVRLDGVDVTAEVRSPEVNRWVSVIACDPSIRAHLAGMLREMAKGGGVVMDGRDIGTVVLPDAEVKVFLTASLAERATRRRAELVEQGFAEDVATVRQAIVERDRLDATRAVAPLTRAADAMEIDSTGRSAADVAAQILALCLRRAGSCSTP